jgi:oligopeptide/dipeptide ABC transporter ATP-binding protein
MTQAAPLLELDDLRLSYRVPGAGLFAGNRQVTAVDGVSFSVAPAEAFGLVGESGCGKSSLAKAVLYLAPPTGGAVRFAGTDLGTLAPAQWRPLRRRLQYIFQDPLAALDPRMTVVDQVAEALLIHRLGGKAEERRERAYAQLVAVGLKRNQADKHPHALSGGQRQRAVIARALVLRPDLLICDEPLSALDVSIQAQVVNLLADLRAQLGLALLFISHDLALVRHLCTRVAVMYMGRVVELGATDELFNSPRHPYTRALVAAVPVPEPRAPGEAPPPVPTGEPPSLLNPPSGCPYHPRCPQAFDRCRQEKPVLRTVAPGRTAACHLEAA